MREMASVATLDSVYQPKLGSLPLGVDHGAGPGVHPGGQNGSVYGQPTTQWLNWVYLNLTAPDSTTGLAGLQTQQQQTQQPPNNGMYDPWNTPSQSHNVVSVN